MNSSIFIFNILDVTNSGTVTYVGVLFSFLEQSRQYMEERMMWWTILTFPPLLIFVLQQNFLGKMTSTKKYKVNPSMLFCSQIIFCVRRKYRKKYSAILYWSHNSKSWKIKALFTQKTDEVFKIYAPQINAFIWGESVKICHYHLQMKQTSKSHAKRPLRLLADQKLYF